MTQEEKTMLSALEAFDSISRLRSAYEHLRGYLKGIALSVNDEEKRNEILKVLNEADNMLAE